MKLIESVDYLFKKLQEYKKVTFYDGIIAVYTLKTQMSSSTQREWLAYALGRQFDFRWGNDLRNEFTTMVKNNMEDNDIRGGTQEE
jgi:hypothetical protein